MVWLLLSLTLLFRCKECVLWSLLVFSVYLSSASPAFIWFQLVAGEQLMNRLVLVNLLFLYSLMLCAVSYQFFRRILCYYYFLLFYSLNTSHYSRFVFSVIFNHFHFAARKLLSNVKNRIHLRFLTLKLKSVAELNYYRMKLQQNNIPSIG